MRVLLTTQPGYGHWHPLVPFAQELEKAGHEVAFATAPEACRLVEAAGYRCFAAGEDITPIEWEGMRADMSVLSPVGEAQYMWKHVFAEVRAGRNLPAFLRIAEEWRPGLIVRENTEFAGSIAAEHLGIPHAVVQITAWRGVLHKVIFETIDRLCESVGLPGGRTMELLYRYLVFSPRPLSLYDPEGGLPKNMVGITYESYNGKEEGRLPEWVSSLPARPTVYATMGTVFNQRSGALGMLVEAFRDEEVNFILTTGPDVDPVGLGPQPDNVHIERYIPQSMLMPHCDLVVNHAGSGTMMDALVSGLPMVMLPVAADQPLNAQRCAQLGLGLVVGPGERTSEAVRLAAKRVLREPKFRRNAQRMQAEIKALPGLEHAVELLERLVGA